MAATPRRGDVVWADLTPRTGSEQSGRRPVIIVSDDAFNRVANWRSLIVVPVSSVKRSTPHRGPTKVELAAGVGGLRTASFALCHQVTTIDRGKLGDTLGALDPVSLHHVEEALRLALALALE